VFSLLDFLINRKNLLFQQLLNGEGEEMKETNNCILLVDDEAQVVSALRRALMDEDYEIFSAQSGQEALQILASQTIKVVVCDERMPGMSGAELLSIICLRYPTTVRIMLTGYATVEAAMRAVNQGDISRFFSKPWNDFELKFAIREAIEKYNQEIKVRELMALIRTQHLKLNHLKQAHPKIQSSEKPDDHGYYMPELTDQEIARILKDCQIS
jgi:DNA-binding NtrC family response regulator